MSQGLRWDGAVEDIDEDSPPQDGRVVGDDDEMISPGGIAPPEGKSAPA